MSAGRGPAPTAEQRAAVEAFTTGGQLVLEAGAGTGKTSTLKMLAAAAPSRRGVYVAFNKAIAAEARRDFPGNVSCSTAHSLAFQAVGRSYAHRLNGPRVPGKVTADILGVNQPHRINADLMLAPQQVARVAMDLVTKFCHSADPEPDQRHLPKVTGVESPAQRRDLAAAVVPLARKAWRDLCSPDGRLKFSHDHYLKLWQLSQPRLDTDFVLLDEAQDANPVIADIVTGQTHAQQVLVGDSNQSIYGWRGAIDAMAGFAADHHLYLSQSFRFGHSIAEEANIWLELLGAKLRLSGTSTVSSRLELLPQPDAVLCRTNAHAVARLLAFHDRHVPAALVGGGRDIKNLAQAAVTLKAGAGCFHPELCAFQTWGQVQDYVDHDHGGADLAAFVKLIDSYGPDIVIAAIDQAVDERHAKVTVSTAHKAKGREWSAVRIADDFTPATDPDAETKGPKPPSRAEAMLAYVAVTRARLALDNTGLAWVHNLPDTATVVGGEW